MRHFHVLTSCMLPWGMYFETRQYSWIPKNLLPVDVASVRQAPPAPRTGVLFLHCPSCVWPGVIGLREDLLPWSNPGCPVQAAGPRQEQFPNRHLEAWGCEDKFHKDQTDWYCWAKRLNVPFCRDLTRGLTRSLLPVHYWELYRAFVAVMSQNNQKYKKSTVSGCQGADMDR